jgi:predicted nucleic acid-binding protein
VPKYVLDSNCYIDAARNSAAQEALAHFVTWAAPQVYLSAVVAAELRAGTRSVRDRTQLEQVVLEPFVRRRRVITPSPAAWDALGLTLATLAAREGLEPQLVRRSFAFDVLLAYSAREAGATVVSRDQRDMARIRRVFTFEFVAPYPDQP